MQRVFNAAIIISAVDRFSSVFNSAVNGSISKLGKLSEKANDISRAAYSFGRDATAIGAASGATLIAPIAAFAELEEASLRLKSVMMKDGGMIDEKMFKKVNDLAVQLGNKLPGTTEDFERLFAVMLENNVTPKSILDGVGKAAAYLAVQLKIPTEQAGMLAAKVRTAMGIQDKDMMGFMDVIARMKNVGVNDVDDIQNAFARAGGQLKFFGIQGLEASKDMASMFAMFINAGAHGQTVGTNFARILSEISNPKKINEANEALQRYTGQTFHFFKTVNGHDKFVGVAAFVAELSKLKGLSTNQIGEILKPLSGLEGMDDSMLKALSVNGIEDFNKMQKRMSDQATLTKKVDLMLTGLKLKWEAATGTFTNALAAWGGTFAPILKNIADKLNIWAAKLQGLIERHPRLFSMIGQAIGYFSLIMITVGGAGLAIAGIAKTIGFALSGFSYLVKGVKALQFAFFALRYYLMIFTEFLMGTVVPAIVTAGEFLLANPIILIIAAIALAALLIVKYWTPIKAFFLKIWEGIKSIFSSFLDWFKGWGKWILLPIMPFISIPLIIYQNWDKIKAFFHKLWENVKHLFTRFWEFVKKWAHWLVLPLMPFLALPMLIYKNWDKIKDFFLHLWEKVKQIFHNMVNAIFGIGKQFYEAGKHIIHSIWNGIKSVAHKPVQAIKDVVHKMRRFLPFSPAKEGPFMDLHKLKIVETIAQSIKPAPAVKAMGSLAQQVSIAFPKQLKAASAGGGGFAHSGGGGVGITISYAPVIHIGGGSATDKSDFASMLRSHSDEIIKMIKREAEKLNRTKF